LLRSRAARLCRARRSGRLSHWSDRACNCRRGGTASRIRLGCRRMAGRAELEESGDSMRTLNEAAKPIFQQPATTGYCPIRSMREVARYRRRPESSRTGPAKGAPSESLHPIRSGFSNDLPYPDVSFDRVLSSFMFRHIEPGDKERTLAEVRRTLKPGGEFHLRDFGGSSEPSGFLAHLFHSHSRLKDNFGGRILALMAQAGLRNAQEIAHRAALFRSIVRYRATASFE
jgi:SAM-dependent methyltransferase